MPFMRVNSRMAGLYLVTPDDLHPDSLLLRTAAALRGGARILQYRRKATPEAARSSEAGHLAELCRAHGALFIVNDDARLAAAVGADGVHLGRDDGTVAAARAVMGPAAWIGVSCYDSLERAHRAMAEGADYVAFGSFFASSVKPDAVRPPMSLLGRARAALGLPVVAIGGITAERADALIEAGADALAVITDVYGAAATEARAAQYAASFARHSRADQPTGGET